MSRLWAEIVGAVVATAAVVTVVLMWPHKFTLSSEYTSKSGFQDATVEEIQGSIDAKKSFAVFVYQPECRSSEDLEKIVKSFSEEKEVIFLRIAYSELKESGLIPELKYYPSVVLYRDGKVVDFLKANDDSYTSAYTTSEGFREWWGKYIKS